MPGNKTLNVFHISNLDFITISLKREPISKFCLPLLDTDIFLAYSHSLGLNCIIPKIRMLYKLYVASAVIIRTTQI